jgi:hypothetical protein
MNSTMMKGAAVLAIVASLVLLPAAAFGLTRSTNGGVVADSPAAPVHRGHTPLAGWLLSLSMMGLAGTVVITQLQPTNQIPTHDTYVATVSMAAADGTATIPHGLGVTPLECNITPLTQGADVPYGGIQTTIGGTNIVVTKATTSAATLSFQIVVKKPHTIGL